MTKDSMVQDCSALARLDPAFRPWLKRVTLPSLPPKRPHFRTLADAILSQQVSGPAAETICRRTFALCVDPARPRAEEIAALCATEAGRLTLRGAGVSPQKLGYLEALSTAFVSGPLARFTFSSRTDEEVLDALIAVKGIGRWTAEMFLLFGLRRPDVFSPGDLGLRRGIARVDGRPVDPSPTEAQERALRWSPHRSTACLLLWRIAHWKS